MTFQAGCPRRLGSLLRGGRAGLAGIDHTRGGRWKRAGGDQRKEFAAQGDVWRQKKTRKETQQAVHLVCADCCTTCYGLYLPCGYNNDQPGGGSLTFHRRKRAVEKFESKFTPRNLVCIFNMNCVEVGIYVHCNNLTGEKKIPGTFNVPTAFE